MEPRPLHRQTETIIRRLVRRQAEQPLRRVLARIRSEDIAAAMEHLTWAEQRQVYNTLEDPDKAAEVLALLPEESIREVSRELTEEFMVDLLERMEPDDVTDVIGLLPDDVRARVFAGMEDADESEVRDLLSWPPDSAGGIMSTDYFAVPDISTCGQAVKALQERSGDLANVHYAYVEDRNGRLVGVASLRQLVISPPSTPVVAVMVPDPITVRPVEDQEEVARMVARYDLLAIPVIDVQHRLLGIVTVDDVVDVIREEAAEDMMKMAGLTEDADKATRSIFVQIRQRAGWLMATGLGGVLMAETIKGYEGGLAKVAALAFFLPMVIAMAGNVGMQCATIAVRGLATGHIQVGGIARFVLREFRMGIALGLIYGVLVGLYGLYRVEDLPMVGLVLGLSIMAAMSAASLMGAGIPVVLDRLRIDPALATGPLVTMVIDLAGVVVYFNIARYLLGI